MRSPRQWMCGRLKEGHRFDVTILHLVERGTYVIDPWVRCTHCDFLLDEDHYAHIVASMNEELA